MIRYLDNQEKGLTKELWREAFPEDSEDFLDYYDHEKMKENQVLVREEADKIQSMLHLNPYHLQVRNAEWDIDYIVAVATRADMRHRGYMRSLLLRMMEDMRKRQLPFCFLMPAAEAIYTPFQFAFVYDQPVRKLKVQVKLKRAAIEGTEALRLAADWMQHWMEQRYELFARRDEDYVNSLLQEVKSEMGSLDFLYDQDLLVGIQGVWGREKKEQRLLYAENGYTELEMKKPAIMARIITPETFVPVIRLREEAQPEQMKICLELDHAGSQLERLTSRIENMEETMAQTDWENDRVLHLHIGELAQWLFGYRVPEEVKRYAGAEQIDVLKQIFLDEIV